MTVTTSETSSTAAPERILLVDDNPTNLQVLYQALNGRGHELLIARSGAEALELAREAHPALILLDIMMPPGIDGFEVCRRLKADAATRDSVVIFLSARDEAMDKVQGLALEAADYIAKPFDVEEVVARVDRHLATFRKLRALEARAGATDEEPITTEALPAIIAAGESRTLEFKSTVRWNLEAGKPDKRIELAWLKGVVAFLNTDGGTLLLGVKDDGAIVGLASDGFPNDDRLLLHVNNLFTRHIGAEFTPFVNIDVVKADEGTVLAVRCRPSPSPAFLLDGDAEDFFIRVGPGSRKLTTRAVLDYLDARRKEEDE